MSFFFALHFKSKKGKKIIFTEAFPSMRNHFTHTLIHERIFWSAKHVIYMIKHCYSQKYGSKIVICDYSMKRVFRIAQFEKAVLQDQILFLGWIFLDRCWKPIKRILKVLLLVSYCTLNVVRTVAIEASGKHLFFLSLSLFKLYL